MQPLGREEDGPLLAVDSAGIELVGGGLCVARSGTPGECLRCDGAFNGHQGVPAAQVHEIRHCGGLEALQAAGPPTLPGGACRSMWWVTNNPRGAYAARAILGQASSVDLAAEGVIARFA